MPSPQIQNPQGAFGLAGLSTYHGDDLPAVIVDMSAVTAISRGEVVAMGGTLPGNAIRCLTATAATIALGIAVSDAAIGTQVVPVIVQGPCNFAKKDTAAALTAGNYVQRSGAVSGTVAVISAATAVSQASDTGKVIGIVVADASAAATSVALYVTKF